MEKQTTLQTVERALSFLEFVAAQEESPTINDVSKSLNLNITTCYHLLRTLQSRQYLKRNENGGLELGQGVGNLFNSFQNTLNTEEKLSSIVKHVTAQTQETAFLSLKEDNKVILKALIEGSQRLRVMGLYIGLQGQEYRRASGKVILAFLAPKEKQLMLESSLAHCSPKERNLIIKKVEKELTQIKERGWSEDHQTEDGIIALGAPIFDKNDKIIGAVGIIAPAFRMEKAQDEYLNTILTAASEASLRLKSH